MKVNFCALFLCLICLSQVAKTKAKSQTEVILRSSISSVKALKEKEEVPVVILSLLSSEYSQLGDQVEVQIIAPENSNNRFLKSLRGAVLKGKISSLKKSRQFNRSAYLEVSFDRLQISPDFFIPVEAVLRTEEYVGQNAQENFTNILSPALIGAANSLVFTPFSALYSGGLSVLIGAGVASTIAAIDTLRTQGNFISLFPGEQSKVVFLSKLEISTEELKALKQKQTQSKKIIEDLKLQVLERSLLKSKIFGGTLITKIKVSNQSQLTLYPCDFFLLPNNGGTPIPVNLQLSGSSILKSIKHGEKRELKLHFAVREKSVLNDYKLVIIDPIDKARLSEIAL